MFNKTLTASSVGVVSAGFKAFSRAFKILAIIKSSANRANAEITTNTRTIETYPKFGSLITLFAKTKKFF